MFGVALYTAIAAIAVNAAMASASTNYAHNRTTMVHLFEWKWNDIAIECERFLGPMGYAGVQVSPVQENVIIDKRPWYERYQPVSYLWDTRSGTEEEFRSMVQRCNAVGVRIYVDILMNHMSGDHNVSIGTAGSLADPSIKEYPAVPFDRTHFHATCQFHDLQSAENVRNCELFGLHDLDQSQEHVRQKLVEMLNRLVDSGVAGFRVDAAKHMWIDDLTVIYSRMNNLNVDHGFAENSRPFMYQEVVDFGGEAVSKYEYNKLGAVTELLYGLEISRALRGRNLLKWFVNWGEAWNLLPSNDAFVFIDNHDNQRTTNDIPLNYKTPRLYKIAVAFMLAHPYGHPQVMSSFDFSTFEDGPPSDTEGNILTPEIAGDGSCKSGWVCEHRWRQIYNMVGFRNFVGDAALLDWWDNGANQIAFCRGDRGFIAINADSVELREYLRVCLPAGTYCDIISGDLVNGSCTGKSIQVHEDGKAYVEILNNEVDGVLALRQDVKLT